jgi:hypothetical protein
MSNYDFAYLSSFDFEVLVRDLLQKDLNLTLESFKSGRDEGIDLRYSKDSKGALIVQCKHYIGSTLRKLIHGLKTEEREKVHKLQPGRYLLATSLGLTPKNKEEIREIFYPYCLSPGVLRVLPRFYGHLIKAHNGPGGCHDTATQIFRGV